MTLRFVVSESAFDYFRTTRAYLETHGKPVAFYSDKHNIFRVNNGEGGNRVTQFGRALVMGEYLGTLVLTGWAGGGFRVPGRQSAGMSPWTDSRNRP
jgi:hypothetical protein